MAAFIFGNPSRKIKVVGITGTNGKTTVVEMLSHILREQEFKVASLSSIKFQIHDQIEENKTRMTMPGRFFVQKLLQQAVRVGCQYFVMEVTSQGIEQSRHDNIYFDAAIFTNLSPEHVEAHGGYNKYRAAKGKFFDYVDTKHIINLDDKETPYFLKFKAQEIIGYGLNFIEAPVAKVLKAISIVESEQNTIFEAGAQKFKLPLLGRHNIYNALAAIAYCQTQNISLEKCSLALENFEHLEGRGEIVIKEPFKVVVDYAFTPPALEGIYQTFKKENNRLIAVLGSAGGGRDKWKRPVLGEIADKYCDQIIVTNEDPFDEDPKQIIEQVAVGVKKHSAFQILDRREAIRKALQLARPGDVVIITGKGSEPSIVEKDKKIPWDDRQVVREEFKGL